METNYANMVDVIVTDGYKICLIGMEENRRIWGSSTQEMSLK